MSTPQRMVALKKAETVRLARSKRKRWLCADGNRRLALERALMVLDDVPPELLSCEVSKFLVALPRIGRDTMAQICAGVHIAEWRRLDSLTVHSKRTLAAELMKRLCGGQPEDFANGLGRGGILTSPSQTKGSSDV